MGGRRLLFLSLTALVTIVALAAFFLIPPMTADAGGPRRVYLPLVVRPVVPPPAAPTNLRIEALSTTSIRLTWTDNSGDETRWRIRVPLPGGEMWIEQPNVTTLEIGSLTPGATYGDFQVQACNVNLCSGWTDPVSVTMPIASGVTRIRFLNESLHYVVSLKIDGVEKLPNSPLAIATGAYLDFDVSAGAHSYEACTGFWNTDARPPARVCHYFYSGSWNQPSGQTLTIRFAHPTIGQILTDFGTTGAWKSYRIDASSGVAIDMAFVFRNDGTWEYYESILNLNTGRYTAWQRLATGNYWLTTTLGAYISKFRIGDLANDEAWIHTTDGYFYLSNGALDKYIYQGHALPAR